MLFRSFSNRLQTRRAARRMDHGRAVCGPRFETLEDRRMLSFTPAVSYAAGANPQAVVAADFNNDGRDDVAVANAGNDNVSVFLGNADGTLQPTGAIAAGDNPVSLAVGDFNS